MEKDGKYIGTAKIGPKGQIVIPKEVRQMFGVKPGDSLIILADREKGIALHRLEVFSAIADSILSGKGDSIYPENTKQENETFARVIKEVEKQND